MLERLIFSFGILNEIQCLKNIILQKEIIEFNHYQYRYYVDYKHVNRHLADGNKEHQLRADDEKEDKIHEQADGKEFKHLSGDFKNGDQ